MGIGVRIPWGRADHTHIPHQPAHTQPHPHPNPGSCFESGATCLLCERFSLLIFGSRFPKYSSFGWCQFALCMSRSTKQQQQGTKADMGNWHVQHDYLTRTTSLLINWNSQNFNRLHGLRVSAPWQVYTKVQHSPCMTHATHLYRILAEQSFLARTFL